MEYLSSFKCQKRVVKAAYRLSTGRTTLSITGMAGSAASTRWVGSTGPMVGAEDITNNNDRNGDRCGHGIGGRDQVLQLQQGKGWVMKAGPVLMRCLASRQASLPLSVCSWSHTGPDVATVPEYIHPAKMSRHCVGSSKLNYDQDQGIHESLGLQVPPKDIKDGSKRRERSQFRECTLILPMSSWSRGASFSGLVSSGIYAVLGNPMPTRMAGSSTLWLA